MLPRRTFSFLLSLACISLVLSTGNLKKSAATANVSKNPQATPPKTDGAGKKESAPLKTSQHPTQRPVKQQTHQGGHQRHVDVRNFLTFLKVNKIFGGVGAKQMDDHQIDILLDYVVEFLRLYKEASQVWKELATMVDGKKPLAPAQRQVYKARLRKILNEFGPAAGGAQNQKCTKNQNIVPKRVQKPVQKPLKKPPQKQNATPKMVSKQPNNKQCVGDSCKTVSKAKP